MISPKRDEFSMNDSRNQHWREDLCSPSYPERIDFRVNHLAPAGKAGAPARSAVERPQRQASKF